MTEKIGFGLQFDFCVVLTVGGSRLFVMSGCEGLEQQHSFSHFCSILKDLTGFLRALENLIKPKEKKL